jgi:hypothetical protein
VVSTAPAAAVTTTFLKAANNAETTLNGGVTEGATEITPTSMASFPSSYPFDVTIDNEIVHITGASGANWTCTRGAQGKPAESHINGAKIELRITAKQITDLNAAVNLIEEAGAAPSGPAGGDLTGTYPNPTIGAGRVNNAKYAVATTLTAEPATTLKGFELTEVPTAVCEALSVGDEITAPANTPIQAGTYVVEVKTAEGKVLMSRWAISAKAKGTFVATFHNVGALEGAKLAPLLNALWRLCEPVEVKSAKQKLKAETKILEGLPTWLTNLLTVGAQVEGEKIAAKTRITKVEPGKIEINNATTNKVEEPEKEWLWKLREVGALDPAKIAKPGLWAALEAFGLTSISLTSAELGGIGGKINLVKAMFLEKGIVRLKEGHNLALAEEAGEGHAYIQLQLKVEGGGGAGPYELGGLLGWLSSTSFVLENNSETSPVILLHLDPEGSAGNQFISPTGTHIELLPKERVTLFKTGEGYEVFAGNATSKWTAPTFGAKVEKGEAEPQVRIESQGARCYLRGSLKVKAGEELKAGEEACTLPEHFRPKQLEEYAIVTSTGAATVMKIATTGVVTFKDALTAGRLVWLSGINFGRS